MAESTQTTIKRLFQAPLCPTECAGFRCHRAFGWHSQDHLAARAVRMRLFCRFDSITKVFADGGYTGMLIGWAKETFGYGLEVVKRNELRKFQIRPKHWLLERTFAWLNGSRRLSKDYELCHTSAETMIHITFTHLLLRPSTSSGSLLRSERFFLGE